MDFVIVYLKLICMKKSNLFALIAVFTVSAVMCMFSSCEKSDDVGGTGGLIPVTDALKNGMIKITEGIGDWESAVIYEEDGYILYKTENVDGEREMDYYQIMSPEADYDCAIYANPETSVPEMLIFEDEVYNFTSEGDSVLYVSVSTDEGTEAIDTVHYTISDESRGGFRFTTISYVSKDDKVKKVVKALNAILKAGSNYTSYQIKKLNKALDDISLFYYFENVETIIDSLDLCRDVYGETGDSVVFCFLKYAEKVKIITYDPCKYGITVETYRPKTVKGNTATVCGEIICISDKVKTLGTWGVIYSTTKANLSLNNYEGIAYATHKNFRLKLQGLKPNTTYYYKTFYKFNSSNHEDLTFRYGNRNAEYYVDSWEEEFTTTDELDYSCSDENHPHMVDLGLPSGTKWACCNVGASSPEENGGHYAWGETEEKNYYWWDTYKWGVYQESYVDYIKYNESDGKTRLDLSDDVAHVKWGGSWRMPTRNDLNELLTNCKSEIIDKGDEFRGMLFTGPNGNYIFMKLAGLIQKGNYWGNNLVGEYWSSDKDSYHEAGATSLEISARGVVIYDGIDKTQGYSVRPVSK